MKCLITGKSEIMLTGLLNTCNSTECVNIFKRFINKNIHKTKKPSDLNSIFAMSSVEGLVIGMVYQLTHSWYRGSRKIPVSTKKLCLNTESAHAVPRYVRLVGGASVFFNQ